MKQKDEEEDESQDFEENYMEKKKSNAGRKKDTVDEKVKLTIDIKEMVEDITVLKQKQEQQEHFNRAILDTFDKVIPAINDIHNEKNQAARIPEPYKAPPNPEPIAQIPTPLPQAAETEIKKKGLLW